MTLPELLLIFTASALGSVHCAAMCGGFTLSLVRPGYADASLARMSIYHAGKLFTYVFIGGVAGVAGAALMNQAALRAAQTAFSALAGVTIVVVGLQTLGLVPGQSIVNRIASRLWVGPFLGPFFRTFREQAGGRGQASPLQGAFLLGVFNGFLPCGLVYAFAIAAAGTGTLAGAMITMLAFGLGTVPMLVAVGLGGLAIGTALRPTLARASGVLVIALGVITVLRGTPLMTTFAAGPFGSAHGDHAGHMEMSTNADAGFDLDPAPAPGFALTDQDGRPVSLRDYHGKVVVMDFIYTSCTTECPLLTATLRTLQDKLGTDFGRNVALVSITVDPARDTPQVLRAFGERWGADLAGWAFLTGSEADVQSVTKDYAVYVERTSDGLSHSETILLIDRHGQLRSVFGLRADPQIILEKIRQLTRES
ncbi:MAG: sulfite exporter TauE/SafE family protein [Chloroflexi bacterium]|nr:sulfite exporter TauE/SafE family protein [Chloroflexota bacterium]